MTSLSTVADADQQRDASSFCVRDAATLEGGNAERFLELLTTGGAFPYNP